MYPVTLFIIFAYSKNNLNHHRLYGGCWKKQRNSDARTTTVSALKNWQSGSTNHRAATGHSEMLEWLREKERMRMWSRGAGQVGEGRGGEGGWAFAVTKCEALHALIPVHKSHRQIKPSTWFTAGINTTRSACVRETWYERWVDRRLQPLPQFTTPSHCYRSRRRRCRHHQWREPLLNNVTSLEILCPNFYIFIISLLKNYCITKSLNIT